MAAAGYGSLEAVLSYADIADYVAKDEGDETAPRLPVVGPDYEQMTEEDEVDLASPQDSWRTIPSIGGWTRSRLFLSSMAFLLVVCVAITVRRPVVVVKRAEQTLRTTMRLSAKPAASSTIRPSVRASNTDYGEVKLPTSQIYGFDLVMEANRATTLEVMGDASSLKVEWYVTLLDRETGEPTGDALYDGVSSEDGGTITVTCTSAGDTYRVEVKTYSDDGELQTSYQTDKAACRYVRREIRSLTDADREAYLTALEVMYRTPLDEGRSTYGEHFANYELFTTMHNSMKYCYHGGDHFITSHAAFTQLLDESLQLMEPTLTQPYWDFMRDSSELGTEWYRSVIYSDSWFGSVDNGERENYMISRGRFAYVPVAYDPERKFAEFGSDYNAMGFVTSSLNLNAAPYVQRSRHMCGLARDQKLATCDAFTDCFDGTTSLAEWTLCMEVNVHANMHEWHGGAFNCAYDLSEVLSLYPQYSSQLLLFLGTVAHDVWYIYTSETVSQYMTCPTDCGVDGNGVDSTAGCSCTCSLDFDSMDEDTLLKTMEGTLFTLQFIFYTGRSYVIRDDVTGTFRFSNGDGELLAYDDHIRLLRMTGTLFCSGGLSGPLGTGAASNDPIFWPLHPIFDRAWHMLLLSNKYSDTYDMTWTNGTCQGSSWEDEQVFTNLIGDTSGTHYTNAQLWDLLSPSNKHLPYIYDDFSAWGTCTEWNPCDDC